jgi:hypothetical protein
VEIFTPIGKITAKLLDRVRALMQSDIVDAKLNFRHLGKMYMLKADSLYDVGSRPSRVLRLVIEGLNFELITSPRKFLIVPQS